MNSATLEITEDFYKLEGMLALLESEQVTKGKPKKLWLRRLAFLENMNNYYRFSVGAVRLYQQSYWQNLQLRKKRKEDLDDKSHSSGIAFYGHARVCIESFRFLSEDTIFNATDEKKADFLQAYRDEHRKWAAEMVNKRNGITAHPQNVRQMIIGSPTSWGSSGKMTFNTMDLEHITINHSTFELAPVIDLMKLKEYIEKGIVHLRSIWEI